MVGMLTLVDEGLATRVGEGLGVKPQRPDGLLNLSVPADGDPKAYQPRRAKAPARPSPALSMANTVKDTAKTRKVAILAADGVDEAAVATMSRLLTSAGAVPKVIAPRLGLLKGAHGGAVKVDMSLATVGSVLFDAVYLPGGPQSAATLEEDAGAVLFVREAFKHCKALAATGAGAELLPEGRSADQAILVGEDAQVAKLAPDFILAIARHRNWSREAAGRRVPA
jgi:catalase